MHVRRRGNSRIILKHHSKMNVKIHWKSTASGWIKQPFEKIMFKFLNSECENSIFSWFHQVFQGSERRDRLMRAYIMHERTWNHQKRGQDFSKFNKFILPIFTVSATVFSRVTYCNFSPKKTLKIFRFFRIFTFLTFLTFMSYFFLLFYFFLSYRKMNFSNF